VLGAPAGPDQPPVGVCGLVLLGQAADRPEMLQRWAGTAVGPVASKCTIIRSAIIS